MNLSFLLGGSSLRSYYFDTQGRRETCLVDGVDAVGHDDGLARHKLDLLLEQH